MSDVMIRVENLGKKYMIGHQAEGGSNYVALRDVLADGAKSFVKRFTGRGVRQRPTQEEFWALKDVSFEVKRGECVGIIGRNGAGKSTLLKILSRITEPTTGRIELNGRVASLLEVGTGFHPELTGRENIYLNGAILGMSRVEIRRKFDEIVDFAEVEKFLDTPVKRYSSGMYVRLAFAVAAHMEPEILVVDEVLAVGDAAFQKKCLGKMGDVAEKEGRTVLFVSHNMGAILHLTRKSIFLENGNLSFLGSSEDGVSKYLSSAYKTGRIWKTSKIKALPIQILECKILSEKGCTQEELDVRKTFQIEILYEVYRPTSSAVIAINIHASDGTHLISLEDIDQNKELREVRKIGKYVSLVKLPGLWLNSGHYLVRIGCGVPNIENYENIEALGFDLIETDDSTARSHRSGYFLPMLPWKTQFLNNN